MAAPAISQSTRYINPGTTKIVFCTTIANKAAPSRAEINAGTDLTREVSGAEGWQVTSTQVDTPDMDTTFTSTTSGRTSAADSALTMYADLTGTDARSLMPRGTNGFILWMDGGDVSGRKMDVFPVRTSSVGKPRSVEGDEAATVVFQYAITSEPAENVTIPA
jgi:hypothetical protein